MKLSAADLPPKEAVGCRLTGTFLNNFYSGCGYSMEVGSEFNYPTQEATKRLEKNTVRNL